MIPFRRLSETLLEWTAHPARRRPRDLALVVAVVALTAAAVLASLESAFLAALAALILVVATAPFLFPTRYVVTDEGIQATRLFGTRSRRFRDLRRIDVSARGDLVVVSPFARRSFLDRTRGLLVFLDGVDRERALSILREKIPRPAKEAR